MAVLEAWSFWKPVLMTPECNLTKAFELNAAIEIMSSSASISKAIVNLSLLSNADLIKYGINGRMLVEKEFCWSKVSEDYIKLYSWMTGYLINLCMGSR